MYQSQLNANRKRSSL